MLAGGSLVQLMFDSQRGTQDIDLINIRHARLSEIPLQTELFLLAKSLGLTPENVNSAISFFVRQVPEWQTQIVLIREGKEGRVYRPTLTLFVYLKLGRGSEIDFQDIAAAVKSCGVAEFDEALLQSWCKSPSTVYQKFQTIRARLGL